MYLPQLQEAKTSRLMTSQFGGYDHRPRIQDGQWLDMKNLTGDYYPMLASRGRRGWGETLTAPAGLTAKDALIWVDGKDLVVNGKVVDMGLSTAPEDCPKQLVGMGAWLVIWPDRKYINTADLTDYGSIDASFSVAEGAQVTYTICDINGDPYNGIAYTKPQTPQGGDLWMDSHSLKRYDSTTSVWVAIPQVYVKITATGIGTAFEAYDGVVLKGIAYNGDSEEVKQQYADLNASKVIWAKGEDWIVVVGVVDRGATQTGGVSVHRIAPDMDYVCQAQNRLWGCRYGVKDGETVNEIYCCKLGDFKNWGCYMGLSTDSWAASVGSDGAWTGAVNYLGYPTFFKETALHRVAVSTTGAHQITETLCRGVQKGSWRSLCVVNEVLYYKGRTEVCAYDGSVPVDVGAALGGVRYTDAVGGAFNGKYYLSVLDGAGSPVLLVYDTGKGMWHKEDDLRVMMFAQKDDDLFFIDEAGKKLGCVCGTQWTPEGDVAWEAVSGLMGYEYPDKKYLSRFDLRVQLKGKLELYLKYDSSGDWIRWGAVQWDKGTARTFAIPVTPRRCDHLQMRLKGTGEMKMFSVARILQVGSDM